MGFRFEFDPANKILVARSEGRLTNESLAELYEAIRSYSTPTDARAGIWDLSSVTDFAATSDFVRELASQKPAMPDASNRPRFIVAPNALEFGLSRMFQIALAALGVQSPQFEPLNDRSIVAGQLVKWRFHANHPRSELCGVGPSTASLVRSAAHAPASPFRKRSPRLVRRSGSIAPPWEWR